MNATVNVSLESLDKLRDEKKQLEEKVKHFEKNEKKVKLIVAEKVKSWEINHRTGDWGRSGYNNLPYMKKVDKYVEREPVYINFEDVIEELKNKAEYKVVEKLGEKDREILTLKREKETIITTQKEDLIALEKKYKETEKELRDNNLKTVDDLQKEIKTLKEEKIDLTKDEEILKLKQQIVELQQVKSSWSLFKFLNK
jgi:hypothetical protein